MKQVIFDTDIGIDDAMALVFLHCAKDVELLAITTAFGNASVENTTRNALYTKELFGMTAPVYQGAAGPLAASLFDSYPDFVHGENGLGNIDVTVKWAQAEEASAAQAIVELVQNNPGEISIVAVGRMTNLADALELCPDLPKLVAEVIVMGGAFGFNGHRGNVSPVAEANIAGDPTAADKVFRSGLPLTIVGLDVTHETIMEREYFETLREEAGEVGEFVYAVSRYYLDFHKSHNGTYASPAHDPSAVAYLLRPDLYTTRDAIVRVALGGVGIGQTIWADPAVNYQTGEWNDIPPCRICIGVDDQAVLNLYRETLATEIR
jgi:purine nucleosidase